MSGQDGSGQDGGAARGVRPVAVMSEPRRDSAERPDLPEGPRTVLSRFAMPADDWARDDAARGPRTLDAMMLTLIGALAVAAGAAVAWHRGVADGDVALAAIIAALAVAAALAAVAMRKVRRDLHAPLSELYAWALGMCTGNFATRMPAQGEGAYRKLAFHINRLSEALERLTDDMDDVVWRQTERLREKNASLELLYEVAASIHRLESVDEILRVCAQSMMDMAKARGATVCLRDAAGEMSVAVRIGECPGGVGSGPDGSKKFGEKSGEKSGERSGEKLGEKPEEKSGERFGENFGDKSGDKSGEKPGEKSGEKSGEKFGTGVASSVTFDPDAGVVAVPLNHQDTSLGVIRLFTESPEPVESSERQRLLLSVGRHLGMSIAKARTDDESRTLSIVRERAVIAYELHDSLAQTLASLRLQADMLADSIARTGTGDAPPELTRIRAALESRQHRAARAHRRVPGAGRRARSGNRPRGGDRALCRPGRADRAPARRWHAAGAPGRPAATGRAYRGRGARQRVRAQWRQPRPRARSLRLRLGAGARGG